MSRRRHKDRLAFPRPSGFPILETRRPPRRRRRRRPRGHGGVNGDPELDPEYARATSGATACASPRSAPANFDSLRAGQLPSRPIPRLRRGRRRLAHETASHFARCYARYRASSAVARRFVCRRKSIVPCDGCLCSHAFGATRIAGRLAPRLTYRFSAIPGAPMCLIARARPLIRFPLLRFSDKNELVAAQTFLQQAAESNLVSKVTDGRF